MHYPLLIYASHKYTSRLPHLLPLSLIPSRCSTITPSFNMSRTAISRPAPAPKRPPDLTSADEICPVCKSSRYLNASLRFLVNPECYHKMCESCVDRIFSHGPAQCPIKGCTKTLRKHRFRTQTFEDIQVEREVDIRRRVAAVFNRREDEFESLRDYNDYLNEVEDITFNLIHSIDIEQTQRRFEAYQKANERQIVENASLAEQEKLSFRELQQQQREEAKQLRQAARREEEDEKRELEENRRDVLNRLASGQDAEAVTKQGAQVTLKKRMDRAAAAERQRQLRAAAGTTATNGSSDIVIKGLKAKKPAAPEAPIDPFGGLRFMTEFYSLQDEYVWEGVRETEKDVFVGAGGYAVSDFTARALCEAFAGLGVFLADDYAITSGEDASAAIGTKAAEDVAAT